MSRHAWTELHESVTILCVGLASRRRLQEEEFEGLTVVDEHSQMIDTKR